MFDAIRFPLDAKQRKKAGLPPGEVPIDAGVLEAHVWARLRKIMLTDPKLAAHELGIPEVARLESLPKPTSTSLQSIGDLYYDDEADIGDWRGMEPNEDSYPRLFDLPSP